MAPTRKRLFMCNNSKFLQKIISEKVQDRFIGTTVSSSIGSWEAAKPYESIPGPKGLPIPYYGNIWRFMSLGKFWRNDFLEIHQRWYKNYGPIVRLTGAGSEDFIFLYDADYFETMYRNDSVWPIRDVTKSITYYRDVIRKDFWNSLSVSTTQGAEWRKNRTIVSPIMLNPKNPIIYSTPLNEVANDFIKRIRFLRDSNLEMPPDFDKELSKYVLESIGVITLDTRLGTFQNASENSDAVLFATVYSDILQLVYEIDFIPSLWEYFTNSKLEKYIKTSDLSYSFVKKILDEKWKNFDKKIKEKNFKPNGVLEAIYSREKNSKMASVLVTELLMGGLDTVTQTLVNALYYISKNQDKQRKLFEELKKISPSKDTVVDPVSLQELKYLKACIKESFRLAPVAAGNQRRAEKDYILGGYHIPKGTKIFTVNHLPCSNEKYFKSPEKFIPERWLNSEINSDICAKNSHPFAVTPFGFGPRSCIGKKLAEFQYETVLAKIFRNFKVEYKYGDMTWNTGFIRKCEKPLRFKFEDRQD